MMKSILLSIAAIFFILWFYLFLTETISRDFSQKAGNADNGEITENEDFIYKAHSDGTYSFEAKHPEAAALLDEGRVAIFLGDDVGWVTPGTDISYQTTSYIFVPNEVKRSYLYIMPTYFDRICQTLTKYGRIREYFYLDKSKIIMLRFYRPSRDRPAFRPPLYGPGRMCPALTFDTKRKD